MCATISTATCGAALLDAADLGVHAARPCAGASPACCRVVEIIAARRALRRLVELRRPLAERIAEPRRLRLELRQAELLPDLAARSMYSRLGSEIGGKSSFSVASISTDASSPPLRRLRGPWPWSRCGSTCMSSVGLARYDIAHNSASAFVRVDVVVDRDDVLAGGAVQHRRAVHRAPDLRRRHVALADQRDHLADVGQRLVHRHALDALDAERVAQEVQEQRLHADALDQARFRRRHLAR